MRQHYIYVLQLPHRQYKIGRTVNPGARFKQMQLPAKPEVVGMFPVPRNGTTGAAAIERELHQRFSPDRRYGEWFDLTRAKAAELSFWCKVLTA